jgi:hypothetical protein
MPGLSSPTNPRQGSTKFEPAVYGARLAGSIVIPSKRAAVSTSLGRRRKLGFFLEATAAIEPLALTGKTRPGRPRQEAAIHNPSGIRHAQGRAMVRSCHRCYAHRQHVSGQPIGRRVNAGRVSHTIRRFADPDSRLRSGIWTPAESVSTPACVSATTAAASIAGATDERRRKSTRTTAGSSAHAK